MCCYVCSALALFCVILIDVICYSFSSSWEGEAGVLANRAPSQAPQGSKRGRLNDHPHPPTTDHAVGNALRSCGGAQTSLHTRLRSLLHHADRKLLPSDATRSSPARGPCPTFKSSLCPILRLGLNLRPLARGLRVLFSLVLLKCVLCAALALCGRCLFKCSKGGKDSLRHPTALCVIHHETSRYCLLLPRNTLGPDLGLGYTGYEILAPLAQNVSLIEPTRP